MERNVANELENLNIYKHYEFSDDLEEHVQKFFQLKASYNKAVTNCKEQQKIINHLKSNNNDLKNKEESTIRELSALRNVCKSQLQSISNLLSLEDENSALKEINIKLSNRVLELEKNIDIIQKDNEALVKSKAENYKEMIEREEDNYRNKLQVLEGEIRSIKTSSELKEQELQSKLKHITSQFEVKLQKAEITLQKYKQQISRISNHCSANVAIYQKKVSELEAQVKTLENERSINLPSINRSSHLGTTNKNVEILKYFVQNKKNHNLPETNTQTSNPVNLQTQINKNEVNVCEPSTGVQIIKGQVSSKSTCNEQDKEDEPLNLCMTGDYQAGITDFQENTAKESPVKAAFPILKKTKYDN